MSISTGLRELRGKRYAEARRAFEEAASAGNAEGYLYLGLLASNGEGEPEDPTRAAKLYRVGAEGGCAQAAHNLGALYALGRGVRRDPDLALYWYRRAGDLGDLDGSFKVGTMLALGEVGEPTAEGFAEAERRWRAGASVGHVGSTLFLGNLYNGLGPELAPAKAAHWYLEVFNQPKATARDVAEARGAIEQLLSLVVINAHAGDAEAAFALGGWHMMGDVDHATAAEWFERAASKGHPGAQRSLGFLLLEGQGIAKNEPRAIELLEAAAAGGDRFAQHNLGSMYAQGAGLPKDSEKAIEYLTAAAEQDLVDAMALLGDELGRLDRDEEARRWYVKAAERGHAGAMNAAAAWYRDGLGGPRDLVQAVRWYWAMLSVGNGDGIHEIHQLAGEMTDDEIRQAARLAGDPGYAEALFLSR